MYVSIHAVYRIFDQNTPAARPFRANAACSICRPHMAHGGVAEHKGGAFPHGDASIQGIDVLHVNPRQGEQPTLAHQEERLCGPTAIKRRASAGTRQAHVSTAVDLQRPVDEERQPFRQEHGE